MSFPLPNGTRVRVVDSTMVQAFNAEEGINLVGKTGVIEKNFIYYQVRMDDPEIDQALRATNIAGGLLCLLPDELEVV